MLPPPEAVQEQPGKPRPESPGTLTLNLPDALATSMLRNPDLVVLRGQIPVNQAMVGVARTPIWNPFVQAEYFPNGTPFTPVIPGIPGSGAGVSNYYVWAMQRFEIAFQRRFRTKSALAALSQAQWNIYQAELLNLAQAMRLYFTALYQKELYGLATDNAELNRRLLGVVERRYRANLPGTRAADVTTARIAARQARRQEDLANATFQAALLALRQQMNIPLSTPLQLSQKLTDYRWLAVQMPGAESTPVCRDPEALAAEMVQSRPDVMAAQFGVQVARQNYLLARAAQVPDVQAGPIYLTADDGTRYLGLRLQMDIPIWNNGGPLARQRRAEGDRQRLIYEQLKVRAALEAQTAIDRYERARTLAEQSAAASPAAGVLPHELKEIIQQFQAGQADIVAVLNTQGNLLLERRALLDVYNELAQAAANVVQATSLPPHRLVGLSENAAIAPHP